MKLCSKFFALAVLVSASALISCAGPSSYSYQNVVITLTHSPVCTGCFGPVGFTYPINPPGAGGITGAVETPAGGGDGGCPPLYVTVTNAPLNPTWQILPAPRSGTSSSNVGNLQSAVAGSNFYCMASGAPVYTGQQLADARAAGIVDANGNVVQGTTKVVVTNPADPSDPTKTVSASLFFAYSIIGGGSTTPPSGVGIGVSGLTLPATVTVPLGGTYQFAGYVTGISGFDPCSGGNGGLPPASVTTPPLAAYSVAYHVNGDNLNGTGAGQYGTVSASGLYTAPAAYPSATVKSTAFTVSSVACPTIISQAVTVIFQ